MALPVEIKTGTYTGTGTAQVIATLGFVPSLFVCINETDGDVINFKINGSAASTHTKIDTATAAVSSNGLTFNSDGTVSAGTDASANESGKTFRFIAVGGL